MSDTPKTDLLLQQCSIKGRNPDPWKLCRKLERERNEAFDLLNTLIPQKIRAMKDTESVKQQVKRVQKILEDSKATIQYQIESENVDKIEDMLLLIETKKLIKEFFDDALQYDETPVGAIRRSQIRTMLLDFSNS